MFQIRKLSIPNLSDADIAISFVGSNLDIYSPFREFAPCRSAFLESIPQDAVRQSSGFFSVACFRGILFGTPYITGGGKLFFIDHGDWETTIQAAKATINSPDEKEKESYVCSMTAYGKTPVSQRSSNNAETFWLAALAWKEFAEKFSDPQIPFTVAFQWIKDNNRLLPSLGGLIQLLLIGNEILILVNSELILLLGDLVCAGAVAPPSEKQFIEAFLQVNKGAASGLAHLGLLETLKSTSPTVLCTDDRISVTLQLYQYLRQHLDQHQLSSLMPDIIHFEHLLCKVSRILTGGPQSYSLTRQFKSKPKKIVTKKRGGKVKT